MKKIEEDISKHHMILMDNVMPTMDGLEATKIIRRMGYDKPIIGLTGMIMSEDIQQFKEKGANEVIGKTTNIDMLRHAFLRHGILQSTTTTINFDEFNDIENKI